MLFMDNDLFIFQCSDPNTAQTDFLRDYSIMKPDAESEAEFLILNDRLSALEAQETYFLLASGKNSYIIIFVVVIGKSTK